MRNLLALVVVLLLGSSAYAGLPEYVKQQVTTKTNSSIANRAAGCNPSQSIKTMEFNNVSAIIEAGGSMWQDRALSIAGYEVPAGSGLTAIYSGALWMAGTDVNGQLKIAANMFRSGGQTDFWSGPLSFNPATVDTSAIGSDYSLGYGTADITQPQCSKWDKFYYITKADVADYVSYKQCLADPTCDASSAYPGYSIPNEILNWPGTGNGIDEDKYMAPYYDADADGIYDPVNSADFPHYVLGDGFPGYEDCKTYRRVTLFGDYTYWWVFNDKGNIHGETGGDPIGMEIRAQAFAFSTADEINDMTFYNYELINRSTLTLTNTYFAQWIDPDVGFGGDDYVGCDVERGLGYAYNADNNDEDAGGRPGYGYAPPAIGVDFFEGPYQDNDGKDNPGPTAGNNYYVDYADAVANGGILYPGMGIGYGDGIVDNERFGMRVFTYYTNSSDPKTGDPQKSTDFYNYLQGNWKNGTPYFYDNNDGTGNNGQNTVTSTYLFPGNTDPQGWGSNGVTGTEWTEATANNGNGNPGGDRRFMQSAGPFTLRPGQVNNITVGVIYARSGESNNTASVTKLRTVDDKAQQLFDNCFAVLDGPDAPELVITELENKFIFSIIPGGNNELDGYKEFDPSTPESLVLKAADGSDSLVSLTEAQRSYTFQGYQVYQIKTSDVSVTEIFDTEKARLIYQTDIVDGVGKLINYENDEVLGQVPVQKVSTDSDNGLVHSFEYTKDEFATTALDDLVNYKEYYYIVVAYGYNEYKKYDITDPNALDGQKKPFLVGRKNYNGLSIPYYTATPSNPAIRNNGTTINSFYGESPIVTRIEGEGNGGNYIAIDADVEEEIVNNYFVSELRYSRGAGPIDISVVDPLKIKDSTWIVKFTNNGFNTPGADINGSILNKRIQKEFKNTDDIVWVLENEFSGRVITSKKAITSQNDIIFDELGIRINISQYELDTITYGRGAAFKIGVSKPISSSITYSDPSKPWITGIADNDNAEYYNWIMSGNKTDIENPKFSDYDLIFDPSTGDPDESKSPRLDTAQLFENLANGIIAPFRMVLGDTNNALSPYSPYDSKFKEVKLYYTPSVLIVFTPDESKWTRSAVLEMSDNKTFSKYDPSLGFTEGADKFNLRRAPSVGKDGNPDNSTYGGSPSYGMSWFPGYAINLENGQRLNIAFGEDSQWSGSYNGNDLLFNPSNIYQTSSGEIVFGGKHYLYVFDNWNRWFPQDVFMGRYNGGSNIENSFRTATSNSNKQKLWQSCVYSMIPMPIPAAPWLSNEVRLQVNMGKQYERFATNDNDYRLQNIELSQNDWMPMYKVEFDGFEATYNNTEVVSDQLENVNVVPNPYYGYASYESNKLDNQVRITNLPTNCTITIFNANGTLVKKITKSNNLSYVAWNLTNEKNIPIAGGTYIIHIDVPGVGEKVIKWFGSLRPPDLENF